MTVIGIIPARLQSTRLPRKLLLAATGKPLIQYVWEAATRSRSLDEVIVAADSEEIVDVVHQFGGRAELTGDHPSGTDRIAEVVRRCCPDADVIVNLQGDEPELNPNDIDSLVAALQEHPQDEMATLATPLRSVDDVRNPNCVKVVQATDGRALYFSRSMIPFSRDREPEEVLSGQQSALSHQESPWLLHLGIYAYRREFLLRLTTFPPSPLERLEKLEQLRALEAGATIRVATIAEAAVGIDTPDDYAHFVARRKTAA